MRTSLPSALKRPHDSARCIFGFELGTADSTFQYGLQTSRSMLSVQLRQELRRCSSECSEDSQPFGEKSEDFDQTSDEGSATTAIERLSIVTSSCSSGMAGVSIDGHVHLQDSLVYTESVGSPCYTQPIDIPDTTYYKDELQKIERIRLIQNRLQCRLQLQAHANV